MYCEQRILPGGGLVTLGIIFSVISSILKISKNSWIFQNTPNLCILDEFEGSYGLFSTKYHFFRHPVVSKMNSLICIISIYPCSAVSGLSVKCFTTSCIIEHVLWTWEMKSGTGFGVNEEHCSASFRCLFSTPSSGKSGLKIWRCIVYLSSYDP